MEYPFGNNFHYQSGNQSSQRNNSDSFDKGSNVDHSRPTDQSHTDSNFSNYRQPPPQNPEVSYQHPYYMGMQSPYYNMQMAVQQRPVTAYADPATGAIMQDQMLRPVAQTTAVDCKPSNNTHNQEQEVQNINNQQTDGSNYNVDKVKQLVHPPPDLNEKLRIVVMQLNQVKGQIISIQANNPPQAKEIISQLACKMQYLQHIYTQLAGMQVPQQQLTRSAHIVNTPFSPMQSQGNLQMYQQQNMQYMQQRLLQQQALARQNYVANCNMQSENRSNQQNNEIAQHQYPAGVGSQQNIPQNATKRRRRKSNSDNEHFSSSPEQTEYDYYGAASGPVRRSTRARKVKNYMNDYEHEDHAEEDDCVTKSADTLKSKTDDSPKPEIFAPQGTSTEEPGATLIEKILGDRFIQDSSIEPNVQQSDDISNQNIEYYVKYKAFSYLHCEWLTRDQMKYRDRLAYNKIKRYHLKKESTWKFNIDDEYFNPDYVDVDRIIDFTKVYIPATVKTEEDRVRPSLKGEFECNDEKKLNVKTFSDRLPSNNVETLDEHLRNNQNEQMQNKNINIENDHLRNNQNNNVNIENDHLRNNQNNNVNIENDHLRNNQNNNVNIESDHLRNNQNIQNEQMQNNNVKTENDHLPNNDNVKTENDHLLNNIKIQNDHLPNNNNVKTENDQLFFKSEEDNQFCTLEEKKREYVNQNEDHPAEKSVKMVEATFYLVKWSSLPYEDCTWEHESSLEPDSIKEYWEREKRLLNEKRIFIQRPNINSWKEISASPVYKNENFLREYQLEGVNWLRYCYYRWQNCILADEMGLGKTIQSICFILELYNLGIKGPFLIIAPLSTIHNWYREFKNWTDVNVVVYHGTSKSRKIIHKHELYYCDSDGNHIKDLCKYEVLITTYEMILAEIEYLSKIRWRACIVDEAHRLKNKKCKLIEGLSYVDIEHRVLLTGTPLQNSLEELYSLLHFLDPQNVANERAFLDEFGNLQNNDQVLKLQKMLKPIMLRRIKEDVEKNLAPKEETIIEVEMTTIQKKIYLSILERNFAFLRKGTMSSNVPNLMNTMMELRKCCNHPFLIKGCEDKIISEYSAGDTANMHLHHWTCLVESSGKMVLVDKLLPKLKKNGHRVLMFSQMVKVLDIIEQYLAYQQYFYERIDGSIRGNLRQSAIDRFSRPGSDRFVFLLCTKAGGLGINLTAADTVIIFDSDWNPQNDIQAQARCHRIGQSKSVKVYRLICRASYEREMFDRASKKLGLDRAVLQNMGGDKGEAKLTGLKNDKNPLSKHEVEDLLRRGAYGAIMDEDIAKSAQFCAEDIDQILERRTEVVQLAGERTGSTFAKASFASEIKNDIDLNDPDFWDKWAKKAKIPLNGNQELFDSRRERKQIKYGDGDGDFDEILSDNDEFSASELYEDTRNRTTWMKAECFKVEKQLLIYGWGRWNDIIFNGNFKNTLGSYDVENISRCIIAFCYHHGKIENTTKLFIEGIIKSSFLKNEENDYNYNSRRKPKKSLYGRRSKRLKDKTGPCAVQVHSDWKIMDPNQIIMHPSYKKHLIQNANKILHRIRLLHFVQHQILKGYTADEIRNRPSESLEFNLKLPAISPSFNVTSWWNEDCDRCLLIGTFKHGFEKYKEMLFDPLLCYQRIIPADALKRYTEREQELGTKGGSSNSKNEDRVPKRRGRRRKTAPGPLQSDALRFGNNEGSDYMSWEEDTLIDLEDDTQMEIDLASMTNMGNYTLAPGKVVMDDWPNNSDLNTRFRRIVTSFWKPKKVNDSTERAKKGIRINDSHTYEVKLTRKEEADFYKALMQFGFEHTLEKSLYKENMTSFMDQMDFKSLGFINHFKFIWDRFRKIKSFDKRDDSLLSAYALYFLASCEFIVNNVHGLKPLTDSMSMYSVDMNTFPANFKPLEGINVEKAVKALNRVDFFEQIRFKVLLFPGINDKLSNLKLGIPGMDFPDWWDSGRHDLELLKMISIHGLPVADKTMFLDESFGFYRILRLSYEKSLEHQWTAIYGNYQDFNQLSYDMVIGLLKWPKQRSLIIRIKKLIHYLLYGIWSNKDIELDDKYRLPVKPGFAQQLLSNGPLMDDVKSQYGIAPVMMMPLKIPDERKESNFDIARQYGADIGLFQEKYVRTMKPMDQQFSPKQ